MTDAPDSNFPDPMDAVLRLGMITDRLSPTALRRIELATAREWRKSTGTESVRRLGWRHMQAASVTVMALCGLWLAVEHVAPAPQRTVIGHLEHIDYPGAIEERALGRTRAIASGEALRVGEKILVRGGTRVAFASAGTLRLAAGTGIEVVSSSVIRLTDGDMYVDIPPERSSQVKLDIETPAGTFTHIGTQFQIAVHGGSTQLRVREGQVRWYSSDGEFLSSAGTRLTVDEDGKATRDEVPTSGADWQWAESLGRPFDIDGHPIAEYLRHFARETGRTLHFADERIARKAATTVMHGSLSKLTAVETLSAVMATTSMRFALTPDAIRIDTTDDTRSRH